MAKAKTAQLPPLKTGDEIKKNIEDAAFYSWLNRGRYAQVGDELSDWIDAEKKVRAASLR